MNISEELMASCEIIITGHDLSTMVFKLAYLIALFVHLLFFLSYELTQ